MGGWTHSVGGWPSQVLQRRLRVVDLVEVLLARVAEPGEAERRRDEQHDEQGAHPPLCGGRLFECRHPLQGAGSSVAPGAPIRRSTVASPSLAQGEAPIRT